MKPRWLHPGGKLRELGAAVLSFLGLGARPPMPERGSMRGEERNRVFTAPHLVFFPGLAIVITVPAFHLLGHALRYALEPWVNKDLHLCCQGEAL